jgi:hypothetical protein
MHAAHHRNSSGLPIFLPTIALMILAFAAGRQGAPQYSTGL